MQDPDYCLFPITLKFKFRQRWNCSFSRQGGEVDAYVNTDKLQIQDILPPSDFTFQMHVLTLLHMDIYTIPTGVQSTSSG